MKLKALGLNGSLKKSPHPSSTQKLLDEVLQELQTHDVDTSWVRLADLNIHPGTAHDEGHGDEWPRVRS